MTKLISRDSLVNMIGYLLLRQSLLTPKARVAVIVARIQLKRCYALFPNEMMMCIEADLKLAVEELDKVTGETYDPSISYLDT